MAWVAALHAPFLWVFSFPLLSFVLFSLRSFHFGSCRWSDLFLLFCQLWCSSGLCFISNLVLLFINDLLNCTSNSVHSYADDSTLHFSTHFKSAPSFAYRITSRLLLSDSILADLERISQWGSLNLVKFNSLKTQLLEISLSKTPPNFSISFDGSPVSPVDNINILGLNINKKMSWKPHITMVAKAASKKLGVLFRLREFFSSQLLQLYKGLIRPCMEYCSHIWGGSGFTPLLDKVGSKAKRLI